MNPSDFHFRVVSVQNSTCSGNGQWQVQEKTFKYGSVFQMKYVFMTIPPDLLQTLTKGGDTWYPGYSWRVCYCPLCGSPVGWQWKKDEELGEARGWVGGNISLKVSHFYLHSG